MVTTYKDIAVALGDSAAARAVGTVMANNDEPEKYPCWRVVRSNGEVGNYSAPGGKEAKIEKMEDEGISVEGETIMNFSEVRYSGFEVEPPLEVLSEKQKKLRRLVEIEDIDAPRTVAGVDVSYGSAGAVAAYVEMDESGEDVLYRKTVSAEEVKFPYIPGYLAYRELPFLDRLLEEVKNERPWAEVIFVDGNGLLHPRSAGLATHLGVAIDHTTVGVAKKLLCGKTEGGKLAVGEENKVLVGGERVGLELKTFKTANPVYVSVGNRINLDRAGELTGQYSTYKLPEPLRQAHKTAKSKATG
jgi:deoxyribonuclease V